jgi:broad specificity phosphatase PhoE
VAVMPYVVCHAETEWSIFCQHTGRTDIPLTVHREEKARRLAPRLSGIRLSIALCSPRQRAQRTCELAGLGSIAQVEPIREIKGGPLVRLRPEESGCK